MALDKLDELEQRIAELEALLRDQDNEYTTGTLNIRTSGESRGGIKLTDRLEFTDPSGLPYPNASLSFVEVDPDVREGHGLKIDMDRLEVSGGITMIGSLTVGKGVVSPNEIGGLKITLISSEPDTQSLLTVNIPGRPKTIAPDDKRVRLHVNAGRLHVSESDGANGSGVLELSNGRKTNYIFTEGDDTGHLYLRTDSANCHVLLQAAKGGPQGNVGIGTTTPRTKLDVNGPLSIRNNANLDPALFDINRFEGDGGMLGWNRLAGQGEFDLISFSGGGSDGGFAFIDRPGGGPDNIILRLKKDGNVGIGTTEPQAKLHVKDKGAVIGNFLIGETNISTPEFPYQYESISFVDPNINLRLRSKHSIVFHTEKGQVEIDSSGTIKQEEWIKLNFSPNPYISESTEYAPIGFFRDKQGIVHLRGRADYGMTFAAAPTLTTILPEGYRPEFSQWLIGAGGTKVNITPDGHISISTDSHSYILDGMTFRAKDF